MDKHYWKDAYKDQWEAASKKEEAVKKLIENETGLEVQIVGLGAGTSGFIAGNATDNNLEKGDADLYITQTDSYVEVTGPNIPMQLEAPLWFRPDKFQNTEKKLLAGKGKLHFVVHVLDQRGTGNKVIRVINLNEYFFKKLKTGSYPTVYPRIRGRQETYIEIPYNSDVILSFGEFIELLKALG